MALSTYPIPATTLVGRDREVAEVTELLMADRLVTLTGLGGTGKTRLALAVAHTMVEQGEKAAFVDLAALDGPEQVIASIPWALGLRATAGRAPIDLIAERFHGDPLALILANFEHVAVAAADVSELLVRCPDLRALVTSRKLPRLSVIGYAENNRRGIANYRIVPLASSGPMEKGVDITIGGRFKTRGMSWFRRGVSHLLQLKLLRLNGTWDRYWAERLSAAVRPWPAAAQTGVGVSEGARASSGSSGRGGDAEHLMTWPLWVDVFEAIDRWVSRPPRQ